MSEAVIRWYADAVETWGPASVPNDVRQNAAFDALVSQRLISRTADATHLFCAPCGRLERIIASDAGPQVDCREGPYPIDPRRIERWHADWPMLCALLREQLAARERTRVIEKDHVHLVGHIGLRARATPVWVVRGYRQAEHWARITRVLEDRAPLATGVILATDKSALALLHPRGSRALWLGDLLSCRHDRIEVSASDVWAAMPPAIRSSGRGRPPRSIDPLWILQAGIYSGEALHVRPREVERIHAVEIKSVGKEAAHSPSYISSVIGKAFAAWETSGFAADFEVPDKSD